MPVPPEYVQPILDFLREAFTTEDVVKEILIGTTVDGGRKALTAVSGLIRRRIREELPDGKFPLNDDLRIGIRRAYLNTAKKIIEDFESQHGDHIEALRVMLERFEIELSEVDKEGYAERHDDPLNTPPVRYEDIHQLFPSYQGDSSRLKEIVESSLRSELKNRFYDEELRPAFDKLFIHTHSADVFPILQNYFFEDYKSNDRLKATFDGIVLVQLVSRDESDLTALGTLPEDTRESVRELFRTFLAQIAEQNRELAERLKTYFDERLDLMLRGIRQIETKVEATHEAVKATHKDVVGLKQEVRELREGLSERETRRHQARQRVVGDRPRLLSFEGRGDKLAKLQQNVAQNGTCLTQICGPVGMGKTALATYFINEDEHFDSIVFVSVRLRDLRTINPILTLLQETLPHDKAEHLRSIWQAQKNPYNNQGVESFAESIEEIRRRSEENKKVFFANLSTTLQSCIRDHKTLIVIDNLEDTLEDGHFTPTHRPLKAFVSAVVSLENHACQLLTTGREPLDITSLYQDFGSAFSSREISLEEGLNASQGSRLLKNLGEGKSGLKDASDEVLEHLVNYFGGIPLSLINLVVRISSGRNMTLKRLLNTPGKLEALRDEPTKVLYESLSWDKQKVMQALAIYGTNVPELAVRYLHPELDTGELLLALETSYAVQFNGTDPATYSLRPLDQDYVYSQTPEDERKAMHLQAASFYRELRKPEEEWKTLEDLQPQVDEIEQLVRATEFDKACDLLTDIDYLYLLRWGHAALVRDLHLQLREKIGNWELNELHLSHLGLAYRDLGEFPLAVEYLEQALALTRKNGGDQRWEGRRLFDLGSTYYASGEAQKDLNKMQTAVDYYKQALAIFREKRLSSVPDAQQMEAACLDNLGLAYRILGKVHKAIYHFNKALVIACEIDDRRGEGSCLNNLGLAYSESGKPQKAIDCYKQALVIANEFGDWRGTLICLGNLGSAYFSLGERLEGMACWVVALTGFNQNKSPNERLILNELVQLRSSVSNFEEALHFLFSHGDAILEEATGQNYISFRNASYSLDYILTLLNELEQESLA